MPKKCNATVEFIPCDKSSFATCDGCQQSFCLPHLNAHQQQLTTQMKETVREHDLLREELYKHRIHSTYEMPNFAYEISLIDAWQTRTLAQVTKSITQEADRARNVIRLAMEENCRRAYANKVAILEKFDLLKKRLAKLNEQLHERMKASDYLESDLRQWNTELSDIKRSSLTPQVPARIIVNKLVVRETRQFQIDISNVLDIKYEDAEKTKVPNKVCETKVLVETVKEKAIETDKTSEATAAIKEEDAPQDDVRKTFTYVEWRRASSYLIPTNDSVKTPKEKEVEAHKPVAKTTSHIPILDDHNSYQNYRHVKK